eukprot:359365-Chlamydomonas_euryale.AAC.10
MFVCVQRTFQLACTECGAAPLTAPRTSPNMLPRTTSSRKGRDKAGEARKEDGKRVNKDQTEEGSQAGKGTLDRKAKDKGKESKGGQGREEGKEAGWETMKRPGDQMGGGGEKTTQDGKQEGPG